MTTSPTAPHARPEAITILRRLHVPFRRLERLITSPTSQCFPFLCLEIVGCQNRPFPTDLPVRDEMAVEARDLVERMRGGLRAACDRVCDGERTTGGCGGGGGRGRVHGGGLCWGEWYGDGLGSL